MLTGKGEKARIRLQAINNDIEMINDKINDLRTILLKVVKNKIDKFVHPGSIFLGDLKHRSMIKNIPNRIEFEFNRLRFFIDFTLVTSESYDQVDVAGSIIYGANRTLCFLDCIYPDNNTNKKCENCERIVRCDKLEDKPLIQFSVNRNGIIKSKDKLEDEMWTIEKEKDLLDLHYRTLDIIWKDALEWSNEQLLP